MRKPLVLSLPHPWWHFFFTYLDGIRFEFVHAHSSQTNTLVSFRCTKCRKIFEVIDHEGLESYTYERVPNRGDR